MKCINAAEAAEEDFSALADRIYNRQSHGNLRFSWLCVKRKTLGLQKAERGAEWMSWEDCWRRS